MDKKDKKRKNLSFVESVANDEQFKPVSLDELEDESTTGDANEEIQDNNTKVQDVAQTEGDSASQEDEPARTIQKQSRGEEQKGKKKLLDVLDKKPEGPVKAIPIPISIHSKIASLSSITDFGISDIASSVISDFLETHKTEIVKMLKRETLNEWK